MAGFFLVLYPLKWTGLNPERLAVRLWLTLHYVDHAPAVRSIAAFLDSLDKANQSADMQQGQPQSICLEIPRFSWGDLVAVFLMLIVGFYLSLDWHSVWNMTEIHSADGRASRPGVACRTPWKKN